MKSIQVVDIEAIEKMIYNWNQNHSKQFRNDESMISKDVQESFQHWIGLEPFEFLQYITAEKIMDNLGLINQGLFETSKEKFSQAPLNETYFSIKKNSNPIINNKDMQIELSFEYFDSPFGRMLIVSSLEGICYLHFVRSEKKSIEQLKLQFPRAQFMEQTNEWHKAVQQFISLNQTPENIIPLHIHGTPFQFQVWNHLLKIPFGALKTYGMIANELNNPRSSRAVGKAVGTNPIAFIIPCHRVVPASGIIGHYMWGKEKKQAIIGWEMHHSQMLS
ncbi:MAG TPA: methylated-DNA--[protein]-cysteine S-methyltransferase [Saprospiraceae bacterium]|nr:methylated-DNA--[protein]-cysteine S-methyltransferase [Saprospiraceae bacterium]